MLQIAEPATKQSAQTRAAARPSLDDALPNTDSHYNTAEQDIISTGYQARAGATAGYSAMRTSSWIEALMVVSAG